jgi:hypothetical protein
MFAIEPYRATRYVVEVKEDATTMSWQPCRVIGIDASLDEPKYIVEIAQAGEFFIDRADVIRKVP